MWGPLDLLYWVILLGSAETVCTVLAHQYFGHFQPLEPALARRKTKAYQLIVSVISIDVFVVWGKSSLNRNEIIILIVQ